MISGDMQRGWSATPTEYNCERSWRNSSGYKLSIHLDLIIEITLFSYLKRLEHTFHINNTTSTQCPTADLRDATFL